MIEKSLEYNISAFLCIIYLSKESDRVRLEDILGIMKIKKIRSDHLNSVTELNTDNTTKIRVNNELTQDIKTTTGIR